MNRIRRFIIPGFFFFIVLIVHSRGLHLPIDSRWSIHVAMSIIKEMNTDLDEYTHIIPEDDWAVESINGHIYTIFPIGASLTAVPFVLLLDTIFIKDLSIAIEQDLDRSITSKIENLVASFVVAITTIFIYLIARLFVDEHSSLLLAFIYAFCTSAWSTASRALWQHGPSMLMLTIALYLILLARDKPWLIQFVSLPLAFAYVIRPTNSIALLVLTLYVLIQHRQYFVPYLVWSTIIIVPFLAYNLHVYHAFLAPYYRPQRLGHSPYFFEALAGNLVSPARGLFIFMPIFLFSIGGGVLKLANRQAQVVDACLGLILLLHWGAISSYEHWWAGHSYGPRLFSDMIPYLTYFLIPVVAALPTLTRTRKHIVLSVFFSLILVSFLINARGAISWGSWNSEPVNVDQQPARVWEWRDPPFLRDILPFLRRLAA